MGYVSLQEGNFELLHVIFYEALQPPPKKMEIRKFLEKRSHCFSTITQKVGPYFFVIKKRSDMGPAPINGYKTNGYTPEV